MNPNKQKGDRAERAVLAYLSTRFPTIKTRAGFNEDLGDLIATTDHGLLVVQVKDTTTARWGAWFDQLDDQVAACAANANGQPILGGILVWKTRGSADPADWRVLTRLDRFLDLIDGRADQ